jgi:hypothetical protein
MGQNLAFFLRFNQRMGLGDRSLCLVFCALRVAEGKSGEETLGGIIFR